MSVFNLYLIFDGLLHPFRQILPRDAGEMVIVSFHDS